MGNPRRRRHRNKLKATGKKMKNLREENQKLKEELQEVRREVSALRSDQLALQQGFQKMEEELPTAIHEVRRGLEDVQAQRAAVFSVDEDASPLVVSRSVEETGPSPPPESADAAPPDFDAMRLRENKIGLHERSGVKFKYLACSVSKVMLLFRRTQIIRGV